MFWFLFIIGSAGINSSCMGKWVTGIIWRLSSGVFLVGQLIDMFLIPGMIERHNTDRRLDRAGL